MTDTFSREAVQAAIDEEQLTGDCPPELFNAATADFESFLAFCNQLVYATKNSIAQRLGLEVRCPCGEAACTGEMQEGCGMLEALAQADLFQDDGDEVELLPGEDAEGTPTCH